MAYLAPSGFRTRPRGLGFTLEDLAAAITRQEGACNAPGVCVNNNPGNLRAYAAGQPVDSRAIRIFPDYESGYAALLAQERANVGRGLTLAEFFSGKPGVYAGYAPAADANDPAGYSRNVAGWLSLPADVPLSTLLAPGGDVPGESAASFDTADEALSGAAWLGLGVGAAALLVLALG